MFKVQECSLQQSLLIKIPCMGCATWGRQSGASLAKRRLRVTLLGRRIGLQG